MPKIILKFKQNIHFCSKPIDLKILQRGKID